MVPAVSLRRLITETHVRSHASPCEISGGQHGSGTGFSPSTSVLPLSVSFHQRSTLILSTYSSYQKEKRAKHGNHPKSSALSAFGQHCIEKHCHLFVTGRLLCSAALRTVHLSSSYLVNFRTRYLASSLAFTRRTNWRCL